MSLMSSNFVGHLNQRNTFWIIMAKRDIFKKTYHKCLEISREDENLKIKKKNTFTVSPTNVSTILVV